MEPSPLLRLSPELRNLIYEYALTTQEEGKKYLHSLTKPEEGANLLSKQPALTRTCRRIRQESLMLYYTLNEFYLFVPINHAQEILTRLERASLSRARAKLDAITRLKVIYHVSSLENTPGCGSGAWLMLQAALVRIGFQKDEVEWKAMNGTKFGHPSRGGNYYVYLAEEARCRSIEAMVWKDWEKACRIF